MDSFLIKMQVHLLRLYTPEWLHTNVRQHGEQDNQLLQVYYKSLFSIEMIKGCLRSDSSSYEAFEPCLILLKSVDGVAQDNSEMMNRPYVRLVQYAFPYMLELFSSETKSLRSSQGKLKSLL